MKIWYRGDANKWTAVATIKTKEAATAVDFAPVDLQDWYANSVLFFKGLKAVSRRQLAIGLETGEILIYSNTPTSVSVWHLNLTLDSRCLLLKSGNVKPSDRLFDRTAHVNHIYRLAWRPHNQGHGMELASCSEDGTLKILIVQVAMG